MEITADMFLAAASYWNEEQACLQDSEIEGNHNHINHESNYAMNEADRAENNEKNLVSMGYLEFFCTV